jgi:hypothetical protein
MTIRHSLCGVVFTLLLSITPRAEGAPGDLLWLRTYSGPPTVDVWAQSVDQTADGGYILAGHARFRHPYDPHGILLVKTDANGDSLWTRYLEYDDDVEVECVRQTDDAGYVLAGTYGAEPYVSPGADLYVVKTDAVGDTLWTLTYGDPDRNQAGYWVEQTSDGGYIVAG